MNNDKNDIEALTDAFLRESPRLNGRCLSREEATVFVRAALAQKQMDALVPIERGRKYYLPFDPVTRLGGVSIYLPLAGQGRTP